MKKLETQWEKIVGLMGKSQPESVYFTTRWGIHTFFMKFPIDVVILDRSNRVALVKQEVRPWRILIWNPVHSRVLELPAGMTKKLKIITGEKIILRFS